MRNAHYKILSECITVEKNAEIIYLEMLIVNSRLWIYSWLWVCIFICM